MRRGSGIVAYRRKRSCAAVAALAGAVSLGGAAHAGEAAAASAELQVSGVDVTGKTRPLDEQTHLSVMPLSIQDTPQAVSIIDGAKLKAQGINTLEQALRNVPGITVAIGEGGALNGDQFKIRGFDSKDDVYVDGLRDFGVYTRDSFNFDQVQVLKGPSGALFGRGTTGGAINTISKHAKLDTFANVDAYAGNGDYYRGLVDLNYRTGEASAVRINLMRSYAGVVDRDSIKSDRWGAAISAGVGLGTDTSFVVNYSHQDDRRRPDYGIIVVQRPGEIIAKPASEYDVGVERSSFLGFKNDVDRTKADIFTAQFAHKFSDHLSITSDTRLGFYSRYFQYSTLDQCNTGCTTALFDGNPATEPMGGIGGSSPYDMDSWGIQNITAARYDGEFVGFRHQTIVGLDISKQVNDKLFFAYTLPAGITTRPNMPHPIVNPDPEFPAGYGVFRAVPGQNITCPSTGNCTTNVLGSTVFTNVAATGIYESRGISTDLAAFLTERVWLTDQVSVIGSLRIDRYIAELNSMTYAGSRSALKVESTLRSPRVNLLWEPADDRTFYLSWGRSETPQGTSIVGTGTALTVAAKDLKPEESEMLEAGAKVAIPKTPLALTLSAFQIKKDNALQADPANPGFLLAQSGERQEVKGVEIGLTGQLTPAWRIDAAYTYLDSKIKESFSNCSVPTATTATTGTPTNVVCPVGVTAAIPVLNTVAVGRQVAFVPKHSASIYSTYDLSDFVEGLSIGGDVVYQSKLYLTYTARSLSYADRGTLTAARLGEAPASLTFDAFASYKRGPYRFGVNVYNIANRLNYTQVQSNRAVPAAGRTVIVSVGASF
ncbi:TonB-dependent receptor [Phenylobacterium sp. LjRoot225]|uniref:TonB-dependent receptor n=1 Tax=Phenylobacterium sp. LjRoot225 TaxID=3342285 RepID=UPI003ECD69C8